MTNAWTFFAYLYQHFDVSMLQAVQQIIMTLANALSRPLIMAITLWIAGTAGVELFSPGGDPMMGLFRKIIRAALVISAVSAANYTTYFGTFLLTTFPAELTAVVTSSTVGTALGPAAFDTLFGGAWASYLEVLKNAPSFWSAKGMGIAILASLFIIAAALCIGYGFYIYLSTHVLLGVAIAIGPLFVCCILWVRTTRYFDGWLGACLGLAVAQVLIVTLLSLLITVETDILKQIAALNGKGAINFNDEFAQIHYMLEGMILFAGVGYLAKQMPDLARAIMGGVSAGIAPITSMASAALSTAVMTAGGAVSGGIGAVASRAAGMRSLTPAGSSP